MAKRAEKHGKDLASKIIMVSACHPLTFAKTLIQLGHEPYPLVKGKKWLLFGDEVYFQPNVFKYSQFLLIILLTFTSYNSGL